MNINEPHFIWVHRPMPGDDEHKMDGNCWCNPIALELREAYGLAMHVLQVTGFTVFGNGEQEDAS